MAKKKSRRQKIDNPTLEEINIRATAIKNKNLEKLRQSDGPKSNVRPKQVFYVDSCNQHIFISKRYE